MQSGVVAGQQGADPYPPASQAFTGCPPSKDPPLEPPDEPPLEPPDDPPLELPVDEPPPELLPLPLDPAASWLPASGTLWTPPPHAVRTQKRTTAGWKARMAAAPATHVPRRDDSQSLARAGDRAGGTERDASVCAAGGGHVS
jgi:hypothetical protein